LPLALFMTFVFPTVVPHLLWGEPLLTAFMVAIFRYIFFLNAEWCVNSVAHTFGNRPYDKDILPTESLFVRSRPRASLEQARADGRADGGRGLAQLSPLLPLRLPIGRAALRVQRDHAVDRV